MLKQILSIFSKEQRFERREIVKLDASVDFNQGIIFGKIYDISLGGFMMLTDSDCYILPLNRNVLLRIDEENYSIVIIRKGSKHIACRFKNCLSEDQLKLLVRKSA